MLSLLSDGRVSWTTIALDYLSAASRGSCRYEQAHPAHPRLLASQVRAAAAAPI